jgi:peptide/nickel transport system permease protein
VTQFILRRILLMFPSLFAISIVTFVIIQLPPGDYLTTYVANLASTGEVVDETGIAALRESYGLNQPIYVQYAKWVWRALHGDFGRSFEWKDKVSNIIWGRLALTVMFSLFALIMHWVIAFPVGIYSAVRKYSIGDYIATFLAFLGVAIPDFLLALVLMVFAFTQFNVSVGGLFSANYEQARWSLAKLGDLLQHLWIPVIILGLSGTAGLIRTMRANLLDELHKPYVITARAKGLDELTLLLRYPVRAALNPFISTVGWSLPHLVSGATIIAIVLNLQMVGPLLLRALMAQDMFLAATFIMLLSVLTLIGTLVSDILLAWLDPRIRFQ